MSHRMVYPRCFFGERRIPLSLLFAPNHHPPTKEAQLREVYGFDCACSACSSGARSLTDALLVSDKSSSGAVPRGLSAPCPLPLALCSAECDRELALADTLMDKAAAEEDGEQELRLLAEALVRTTVPLGIRL